MGVAGSVTGRSQHRNGVGDQPAQGVPTAVAQTWDIVQEVFLRLWRWRQPEQFNPGRGSLRSFLLAQVHGRAGDLVRSESSRAAREERAALAEFDGPYDLAAEVAARDAVRPVRAALRVLTTDERRAIDLAYFSGFTYVEVAQILGAPEDTIKGRIRSELQRLRAELSPPSERDQ